MVVSDIPFFLENVDVNQTAFVFENGDSESLKQSILKALNSKNNGYFVEQQKSKYNVIYSEMALYESITETYDTI
jgi:hypothetical protein